MPCFWLSNEQTLPFVRPATDICGFEAGLPAYSTPRRTQKHLAVSKGAHYLLFVTEVWSCMLQSILIFLLEKRVYLLVKVRKWLDHVTVAVDAVPGLPGGYSTECVLLGRAVCRSTALPGNKLQDAEMLHYQGEKLPFETLRPKS